MLDASEMERCYVRIAQRGEVRVYFFDGCSLEPVGEAPCGPDAALSRMSRPRRAGMTILVDYLARSENLVDATTLTIAFAEQFMRPYGEDEMVFVEEFRIEDWLRVMRMLGETG